MKITRITVGETNCYLLRTGEGAILVDAGPPRAAGRIVQATAAAGLRPEQLKLILVTHGHFDHFGAARAVQEWCGAPIAAHVQAPSFSQLRRNALPPAGTLRGSALRWVYLLLAPFLPVAPLEADRQLQDGDSLREFGFDAQLVAVPGHSPDSLALISTTGDAFVGDLLVNYSLPSQPLYLHDPDAWQASVVRLRALAPRMVYVGHGEPFPGSQLNQIRPPRYQVRWWVR